MPALIAQRVTLDHEGGEGERPHPNRDTTQIHVSRVVMRTMMAALLCPPRVTHHGTTQAALTKNFFEGLTHTFPMMCTPKRSRIPTPSSPCDRQHQGSQCSLLPESPTGTMAADSHFNASWPPGSLRISADARPSDSSGGARDYLASPAISLFVRGTPRDDPQ